MDLVSFKHLNCQFKSLFYTKTSLENPSLTLAVIYRIYQKKFFFVCFKNKYFPSEGNKKTQVIVFFGEFKNASELYLW